MITSATVLGSRLIGVQYLRGVAALMVAYFHLTVQIPAYGPLMRAYFGHSLNLSAGVDLFFVISGLIMVVATGEGTTPQDFLLRRLIRIAPLYWLMTLLVVVGFCIRPEWFHSTMVTPESIVKSLAFIPYANAGQGGEFVPILVPGWSLNFEMAFYAVFSASLLLPARYRLAAVGAVFIVYFSAVHLLEAESPPGLLNFYADLRIAEFWAGMYIGQRLQSDPQAKPRFPWIYWIVIGVATLVLLVPFEFPSEGFVVVRTFAAEVVPSSLIVWCTVRLEQGGSIRCHPFWLRVGDASYSIYLSHILTLGVVRVFWVKAGLVQANVTSVAGFLLVSMLVVGAVGAAVYLLIEQPVLQFMRARIRT